MTKSKTFKKALSLSIAIPTIAALTACASVAVFYALEDHPNANKVIPPEYLNIEENEEGQQVLRGFKEGISIKDIRDKKYNVLSIPRDVAIIAPYAFAFCFDGLCCHVDMLVLNRNIQIIETGAFMRCAGIKYISWPTENPILTTIGNQAFEYCGISNDLILPNSVTTIGDSAFRWCYFLDKIRIPASVTSVGYYAFAKCTNVSDLEFDYEYIPDWMYEYKFVFQHFGDDAKDGVVTVDDKFEAVDNWSTAMYTMQDLSANLSFQPKIVRPTKELPTKYLDIEEKEKDDVILHGFAAEFDIETLKEYSLIEIPNYVTEISDNAFAGVIAEGCNISLSGGEGLYKIGAKAFSGCTGLVGTPILPTQYKEPEDEEEDPRPPTLCSEAYSNSSVSGQVVLNEILVREGAFMGTQITSLTIGQLFVDDDKSVNDVDNSLPNNLVKNCSKLRNVDFSYYNSEPPKWSTAENFKPFGNLAETGYLVLSPDILEADKTQWYNCALSWGISHLTQTDPISKRNLWIIPKFIEIDPQKLPDEYYINYKNQQILVGIKEEIIPTVSKYQIIDFPDRTRYILDNAFNNVFIDGIEIAPGVNATWSLDFPLGLKYIGARAFYGCTGLGGTLAIPASVKEIGDYAFYGCYSLTDQFTIPTAVEKIGNYAFANCSLSWTDNLLIPGTLKELGSYAFANIRIKSIKFLETRGPCIIANNAFNNIPGLNYIDLTDFSKVPDDWTLFPDSFNLPNSGTIHVNYDLLGDWQKFFYAHGLPDDWQVV